MGELTLKQARELDQDPDIRWAENGDGPLMPTMRMAILNTDCDAAAGYLYACRRQARPTPSRLGANLLDRITDADDDEWGWAQINDGYGSSDGCVLEGDDAFRAALEAACELALEHYGHGRENYWETSDYLVVTPEMIREMEGASDE